jgi:hypothetical protein
MMDELKLSLNLRMPTKHAQLPLSRDWNYIALHRAAASDKLQAPAHAKSDKRFIHADRTVPQTAPHLRLTSARDLCSKHVNLLNLWRFGK